MINELYGVFIAIIGLIGLFAVACGILWVFFHHEKGESDPLKMIDAQQSKMDTKAGVFENYRKRRKIDSQTKTQTSISDNKRAVTDTIIQETAAINAALQKDDAPDRHERAIAVEIVDNNAYLALKATEESKSKAEQVLIDQALKDGQTLTGKQQVLLERLLTEVRIFEHKEKSNHELELRWKEIVQDLDAADLLMIAAQQVIGKLEKLLENARIDYFNTQNKRKLKEPLKTQLLEDKAKSITNLENQIRAWETKQTRLSLSQNQNAGKSEEALQLTEGEDEGEGYS